MNAKQLIDSCCEGIKPTMNAKQLIEFRASHIYDFISELGSLPSVEKVVRVSGHATGDTILVRMKDGNAYEVDIRLSQYAQHPMIKPLTTSTPRALAKRKAKYYWHRPTGKLV